MTMTHLDVKCGSQGFDSAVLWSVDCVALGKSFFLKLPDPHGRRMYIHLPHRGECFLSVLVGAEEMAQ